MKLTLWSYEGPPHIGAMRIATGMRDTHYVLHAPQGDTYADLLFTMIERNKTRPPVTYTTFQARDLGADTAQLFQDAARDAIARFKPKALLVGASCTAELIQDDPGGLVGAMALDVPVIPLELPAYQRKENWGAAETFYQVVRRLAAPSPNAPARDASTGAHGGPSCNILGPTAYGFRHRDDAVEIKRLLESIGVTVNVSAPLGASPDDIARLPGADFNVVLYPEIADTAARWLQRTYKQPFTKTVPIGVGATVDFLAEVAELAGLDPATLPTAETSRLPWYSHSVDSTYFTGKRVFIFGDATHVVAAARVATEEFGFDIAGLGTYAREFARDVRAAAERYGVEPLITDDYLEVERAIMNANPELVLGTQMERHIAKRLGLPCAVISAPVHVQDFPARYSPQMGFEGANVLFDTWVHPLTMGLEEHLLGMFREDFEFNDEAPSHLFHGKAATRATSTGADADATAATPLKGSDRAANDRVLETAGATANAATATQHHADASADMAPTGAPAWTSEAEKELKKIPFFVRGKARRNTEKFATETGCAEITIETLYDAKSHFAR